MSRFLRELHEIKTEERYKDSLWFLRACLIWLTALWLYIGVSASSWIGDPSWRAVLFCCAPTTIFIFMLALLVRTPALAFALGLISGSVLLVPILPTNEWKAMNIQTKDLRVGMTSDEACPIVGDLEPACLHMAAIGESIYLRPGIDDANNAAYIKIDFEKERVSGIVKVTD